MPAVRLVHLIFWPVSSLPEATDSTMPSVVISTSTSRAPLLHKCWLARSQFRSAIVLMRGSCRERRQLTSRVCATQASATATKAAATPKTSLPGSDEAQVKAPAPSRLHEAAQAIGGTKQLLLATMIRQSLVRGEHDWQLSIAQANLKSCMHHVA